MRLVFDYANYRNFLRDFYVLQKERHPAFSYARFARQCGLGSPAQIQLILSGKRNLTVHNIHRVIGALALPPGESEFFEALVHLNQAKVPEEKKFYEKRLARMRTSKPRSSARLNLSALLENPFFPAIALSVEGREPQEAVQAAAERFDFSERELSRFLDHLLRERVLVLQTGKIRLAHRHLIFHDKQALSQAQKRVIQQQIRLSLSAFEQMYDSTAKFYSHSFTMNPQSMERFTQEIQSLIERVTLASDEVPGDQVMQLNVQLFPYAKGLKS